MRVLSWISRISSRICRRKLASRLLNGSSSSSSAGSSTSALARVTRCCCPPDSSCIFLDSSPVSWVSARIRSIRFPASRAVIRCMRSPNPIFCSTFINGNSSGCWNTMTIFLLSGGTPFNGRPSSKISPPDGSIRPATDFKMDVLPAPLGPRIDTSSPFATCR